MAELRATAQRKRDVVATLEQNGHAWLATAAGSVPHVIVTQAVWNGQAIIVATREVSRTARNLDESRIARLAFGGADDAIVVDAVLTDSLNAGGAGTTGATFERAAGWSPAE
jgi:hypothetical protein